MIAKNHRKVNPPVMQIKIPMQVHNPQALTPMAPATAEATAMMILRITSQVDFFMTLDF